MGAVTRFPLELTQYDNFKQFDDFTGDQTDLTWIDTITDSGTVTMDSVINGQMVLLPSDGTVADNDEAYVITPNLNFLFAAGKPHYFACYSKFSEAATNAANIYGGFINVAAANTLVDNGGGMVTTFMGSVIHKIDGETVWRVTSSNGSTQTTTKSQTTAGGAFQLLEIIVNDFDTTQCEITFKCDRQYLRDSNGLPIRHYVLYSGFTVTGLGFGVKNGSANQQEFDVDWVLGAKLR